MEYNFAGEWKIQKKISHGSFGEIYKGISINTNEEVAIKLEPFAGKSCQIFREVKILKTLELALGFPKVRWFGQTTGFNIIVLDFVLIAE